MPSPAPTPPTDVVRLDKWLWAARFYKTRSLAAEAIDGGKVDVNGEGVKRAKQVRVGDRVSLRQPPYEIHLVIVGLSERRGPAKVAATLYDETPASRAARERLALALRSQPPPLFSGDKGRPSKKQRREIERWKKRGGE